MHRLIQKRTGADPSQENGIGRRTAGGGLRKVSGLVENYEEAALIGVHYNRQFYEFIPWTGTVDWEVIQWGYWQMSADNNTHRVELEATTKEPGTPLR
ncbi:probable tocopherol cyclase, chloroplastic [Aristolochia californica]|uniref:probable tocopherol cyclase, chloroplastic n=1 Tax=Aristolochia californica TaxID=171875 RepID=UPI0035D9171E